MLSTPTRVLLLPLLPLPPSHFSHLALAASSFPGWDEAATAAGQRLQRCVGR